MPRKSKYTCGSFEFFEDDRGFYYLRTTEGEDIKAEDVVGVNDWIAAHTEGERKPLLIELAYGSTIAHDVQSFLAKGENRFSTADAILISTFAHKLSATFYLRHYKPKLPTRIFSDVFAALDWLDAQRNASGSEID